MKYFTMPEVIRSETAQARGIDNSPTPEHLRHLTEMVDNLMDPLREQWGVFCANQGISSPGIRVSSGYRGFRLNSAVGGVGTSAHCFGYALDLVPVNGRMSEFKDFCRRFLAGRAFDQMISEKEGTNGQPVWIHIGYKNGQGLQRRQYLTMRNGQYEPMT